MRPSRRLATRLGGSALVALGLALASSARVARGDQVTVSVDPDHAIATVDSRYVSFAIDTAQLVGGPWWDGSGQASGGRGRTPAIPVDLADARLRKLTQELAPAILRVGGTEADFLAYDMSPVPATSPPPGYGTLLTARRWDELGNFTQSLGLDLMFGLNAGSAERDAHGAWQPDHARALLERASRLGDQVKVWELGNEPNAYWLTQGFSHRVSGKQYARDYAVARDLVRQYFPSSALAGPSAAFWPILGEPLGFFFGVTKPFLRNVQGPVDRITWHYYPTQSDRCPFRVRPADLATMLDPAALDEVGYWASKVNGWRDRYQPGTEVWLGETGPAQCGGQAGLSDTFADSFWWLDQLGLLARLGQKVQVRQTLVGADYGLLARDLSPNPDFWASLLWKRLMGEEVLAARVTGSDEVRAYAHRTAARAGAPAGSVTVLLLNLSLDHHATVDLQGPGGQPLGATSWTEYTVTAPAPLGRAVSLGGVPLALDASGAVPALPGRVSPARPSIDMEPLSYQLLVIPHAPPPHHP